MPPALDPERRVLIVEDDPVDLAGAERALLRDCPELTVVGAESLEQARALLANEGWTLAIVDERLRDGSGTSLLGEYAELPQILVTGGDSQDVVVTALREGARDYIRKETDGSHLTALADRVRVVVAEEEVERARRSASEEQLRSLTELQQFAREVSHAIGAPLDTARDLGSAVADLIADSDPTASMSLQLLEKTLARTQAFVRSLATYAAFAPGPRVPVRMGDLVDEARGQLSPFDREQLVLRFGEFGEHELDRDGVVAVLRALLENAVRHGRTSEGPVRIDVRLEREERSLRLVVEDDGPGFPEDPSSDWCEAFRSHGPWAGFGLGLALVARAARAWGGSVELSNAGGARVAVEWPLEV